MIFMTRVSHLTEPTNLVCPNCGQISEADPIQLQGKCSLICPFCGYHFYITPKINGIAQVREGALAEVV